MHRRFCIPGLFAGLAVLLAAGCGATEVPYVLVFPSTETLLVAHNVEVDVYDGSAGPDEICRALSVNQAAGSQPLQSSGPRGVCTFLGEVEDTQSGVVIRDVSVGRLVISAVAVDIDGTALMRGCKVADVYADTTEPVEVILATLPTYPKDPILACSTIDEKCEEGLECYDPDL